VIISDASVPGEGEHKIMDYIRRLRSYPEHDPNTQHVIYGLDADLIMLSLATHEPFFRVLREDVFFQGNKPRGCHRCGQFGHHSANCTNPPMPKKVDEQPETKPFIFLDVSILREYLEIELNVPGTPFAFDLERALDDWVFLIFFVGNDFLPHLPSLEIREGAIDTLMHIWRVELPRMGGYVTEHGRVNLGRLQHILDGLASREAEIFRKRRETEERAESRNAQFRSGGNSNPHAMARQGGGQRGVDSSAEKRRKTGPESFAEVMAVHASYVPVRQTAVGLPARPSESTVAVAEELSKAEVKNANLSAAERLKAEMLADDDEAEKAALVGADEKVAKVDDKAAKVEVDEAEVLMAQIVKEIEAEAAVKDEGVTDIKVDEPDVAARGIKRKAEEEVPAEDGKDAIATELADALDADSSSSSDEETEVISAIPLKILKTVPAPLKVVGNNMVEQEDSVKLWEPGYHERYYRQKFGVELSDTEFRRSLVKSYVEGLCWVLAYYYQGCPSVRQCPSSLLTADAAPVGMVLSATFLAVRGRLYRPRIVGH
jgi:5'-3' exoribonuclease 2